MHAGPSQNRNLLERVGKTARVAGHTSPRRATASGLRPQDWIYSRVPTQRDDLRRHEGQGQMDGRLFSPAPTKTRRKHGPPPSPLISKQCLLCTKPSSMLPARHGMPDAQRNPTSRVSNTPLELPIVGCRCSRFLPSLLVGVASSPRTCSPYLRSRSTVCFRPFAVQVIPTLSIIVFSSRTLFIPLTKHTTPSLRCAVNIK